MFKTCLLVAIMPVLLSVGCRASVSQHPLYTDKDLVSDPALPGTWKIPEEKKDEKFEVHKVGSGTYRLSIVDQKGREDINAHLLALGNHRFLDLPGGKDKKEHEFMRISIFDNMVIARPLLYRWLEKRLRDDPRVIAHDWQPVGDKSENKNKNKKEEVACLTAATPQLQAFILENVDQADAFGFPLLFERETKKAVATGIDRKQRTFDYWYEVNALLFLLDKGKIDLRMTQALIKRLPTAGVDPDAVMARKAAVDALHALGKLDHPDLAAFHRALTSVPPPLADEGPEVEQGLHLRQQLRDLRVKLSRRHGVAFPELH